jgi:hypothetical protein
MKYRLLFICLLSVLFVSLTMNVIHSESLSATKESLRISDMVQNKVINDLYNRITELEN